MVGRLGESILGDDGEIDRSRVAERVFGDREALAWLEGLLHPRVSAEYLKWRDQVAKLPDPPPVTVTEVPLLYEVGGDALRQGRRRHRARAAARSPGEGAARRPLRPAAARPRQGRAG
jgi:Dephospho-CoA kinase